MDLMFRIHDHSTLPAEYTLSLHLVCNVPLKCSILHHKTGLKVARGYSRIVRVYSGYRSITLFEIPPRKIELQNLVPSRLEFVQFDPILSWLRTLLKDGEDWVWRIRTSPFPLLLRHLYYYVDAAHFDTV